MPLPYKLTLTALSPLLLHLCSSAYLLFASIVFLRLPVLICLLIYRPFPIPPSRRFNLPSGRPRHPFIAALPHRSLDSSVITISV
ncbi:hypothetical protein AFCA_007251 [Aspergillus flavus]|nr:hypothetical protein AFLA_000047 [Aspergillus flavus NRRL3357]UDD59829.1 hypothetical protein AFCA_007251 [Aspergillus flavus]